VGTDLDGAAQGIQAVGHPLQSGAVAGGGRIGSKGRGRDRGAEKVAVPDIGRDAAISTCTKAAEGPNRVALGGELSRSFGGAAGVQSS